MTRIRRKRLLFGIWLVFTAESSPLAVASEVSEAILEPPHQKSLRILYQAPLPDANFSMLGELRIRDERLLMMVDSGASPEMILDPVVATKLGTRMDSTRFNDAVQGDRYKIPEAVLGEIQFPGQEVPAVDIQMARWITGQPIAGVIGWKALLGKTLMVDHTLRKFQLCEGSIGERTSAKHADIEEIDGIPHVSVDLGSSPMKMVIDTGSHDPISLTTKDFERLAREGLIRIGKGTVAQFSVGGAKSFRSGCFASGNLFDVDLTGMPVVETESHNLIGRLFLLKLNYALSNGPSRFFYRPRKNPDPPISPASMFGAVVVYRGGRGVIGRVDSGGPAEAAGLAIKDEIVKINDIEENEFNESKFYRICEAHAGQQISLEVRRSGESRKVLLKMGERRSAWLCDEEK